MRSYYENGRAVNEKCPHVAAGRSAAPKRAGCARICGAAIMNAPLCGACAAAGLTATEDEPAASPSRDGEYPPIRETGAASCDAGLDAAPFPPPSGVEDVPDATDDAEP